MAKQMHKIVPEYSLTAEKYAVGFRYGNGCLKRQRDLAVGVVAVFGWLLYFHFSAAKLKPVIW